MTVRHIIRLFSRNLKFLLGGAFGVAILIFLLTMGEERMYESKAEIYTGIASGISLNNVDDSRLDFFKINSEFDNMVNVIKSRQTAEDVGVRLLARSVLEWNAGNRLESEYAEWIPQETWKGWLEEGEEGLEGSIQSFRSEQVGTELYNKLFEAAWSPYSYKAVQSVSVNRLNNSDFLQLQYTWKDPWIAKETLEILNEVFLGRIANIKKRQASNVVEYFRLQTEDAMRRLQEAEIRLRDFRIDNDIINYDEQTKQLAVMKEKLEDEQQKEVATFEAAKAAVTELESKLSNHREITRFSDELLAKRQELTEINTQIALLEVYYQNEAEVERLRRRSGELKEELSDILATRYDLGRSTEGLPTAQLLDEWLDATLSVDRSKARLRVFEDRMRYFREQYAQFSPLGSNLGRLEREIGVQEKNYLELLHSYNQAMMRLENEEVSSGGAVVTVPPQLAFEPLPSKRKVMIIAGFLVGAIVPFGFLLLKAFMDRALRNAGFAAQKTGLEIIGGFPSKEETERKNIDSAYAINRAAVMAIQNLMPSKLGAKGVIFFFTTGKADSAHDVVRLLHTKISEYGMKGTTLGPSNANFDLAYETKDLLDASKFEGVLASARTASDLVFVILPPLLDQPYDPAILEQADKVVCLADASREWYNSDAMALKELRELSSVEPLGILFDMRMEDVESLIGEIPTRYNWFLRKVLKYLPK